jgi:hypothetical protein
MQAGWAKCGVIPESAAEGFVSSRRSRIAAGAR